MTQDRQASSSFQNADAKDIGHATKVDVVRPVWKSLHRETWCCAWAPDCSYFAYSQGGGIVYLLPWNADSNCVLKRPTVDRADEPIREPDLIQNLPLLPNFSANHDFPGAVNTSENGNEDAKLERRQYRMDCGDLVCSMAFGSGISMHNIKVWRHFIFNRDLILATGLTGGKIKLWNVHTGSLLMELVDHKSMVRALSFSPDGNLQLVSSSNDCTVKFWDLNMDGNMYRTVRNEMNHWVYSCKWSPDSRHVAAVGGNRCAYIYTIAKLAFPRKLCGHHNNVSGCDFSPDGAVLATCSYDTSVLLWDTYTGDILVSLGHLFPTPRLIYAGGANDHFVRGLSFSRDGLHIATAADDGYIRMWNLKNTYNPECITEMTDALCCTYSPNGAVVSAGNREGVVEFYRPIQSPPSLQHMCRVAVRLRVSSPHLVDHLHYPISLKEFLKYKVI